MADPTVTHEGEGPEARTVVTMDDWQLVVFGAEGEPLISARVAAVKLGFARPRKFDELIERTFLAGQRPIQRPTVGRRLVGPGRKGVQEFAAREYWLTEAQLLKLCARSKTEVAESILDDMIRVYMAARRALTVPQLAPPEPSRTTLAAHKLLDAVARGDAFAALQGARGIDAELLFLLGNGEPAPIAEAMRDLASVLLSAAGRR